MPEQSSMPSAQICKKQDLLRYQLFLGIAAACLCLGTSIIIDTSGGDPGDRVLIFAVLAAVAAVAAVALFGYIRRSLTLNQDERSLYLLRNLLFMLLVVWATCIGFVYSSISEYRNGGGSGKNVVIFGVLAAVSLFEYSWATMTLNRYQKSEKLLLVDIDVQKCL